MSLFLKAYNVDGIEVLLNKHRVSEVVSTDIRCAVKMDSGERYYFQYEEARRVVRELAEYEDKQMEVE